MQKLFTQKQSSFGVIPSITFCDLTITCCLGDEEDDLFTYIRSNEKYSDGVLTILAMVV